MNRNDQPTAAEPAPAPPGFRHAYADLEEIRLHYVVGGAGEPLVLLHGWPETWYAWREVTPALAEHYTVVVPDLRGFGDSSRPEAGYDRRTLAADVRRLVEHLGLDRIDLAGHDWGGSTAYAYAAANRGGVRRLAILEALPYGPWLAEDPSYREPWFYGLHRIPGLPERLVEGRERDYLAWFYRNFALDPDATPGVAIDEFLRCYGRPGGMRPGFELVRALPEDAKHNREYAGTPLDIPVLAVGGEQGMGGRVAENLRHLARDVRPVVIDRCGHFVPEERPDAVTALLLDFFGERPASQRGPGSPPS